MIIEYSYVKNWSRRLFSRNFTPIHRHTVLIDARFVLGRIRKAHNQTIHAFMARCLMTITSAAPRSFAKAIMQPAWHPAINKEIGNFIDNTCFQWIKDVGQRRMMMMMWLFSFKADMTMKARLVVNGKMCKPGLDYNHIIIILRWPTSLIHWKQVLSMKLPISLLIAGCHARSEEHTSELQSRP